MSRKINSRDIFVKDVIVSTAKSLKTKYTVSFNETSLELPKSIGEGGIMASQFACGLGFIHADYVLKEDLYFDMEKNLIHPLKIIFNLGGGFYHKFKNDASWQEIDKHESAIISSNNQNNHQFHIPRNTPVSIFSIEINRLLFKEKTEPFMDSFNADTRKIFSDTNGENSFYNESRFSIRTLHLIQSIISKKSSGFTDALLIESKLNEILYNRLTLFCNKTVRPKKEYVLQSHQKEAVMKASQFIVDHLDAYENVSKLAEHFGMNAATLQHGFKTYFNKTVNEFVVLARLEKARRLLEETDMTIGEIGFDIGITSKSYISKVFKARYGLTPRDYRNSRIKTLEFY